MKNTLLLRTLEEALERLQDTPPLGSPPPFPWEKYSEELGKTLEREDCIVSYHNTQQVDGDAFLKGMGESPLIQPFVLSPVPETLFLILPHKTQKELTALLLCKGLTEETIEEGFMHFTLLNILETFNRLNPYGNLSASLEDETPLPKTRGLAIDVSLQLGEKTLWARIIASEDAHAALNTFFEIEKTPLLEIPELAATPLPLTLEVGSTSIPSEEWNLAKAGDFLLLDRCTMDLENGKGTALLFLGSTPLFEIRIKGGEAKVLQHAPSIAKSSNPPPETDMDGVEEKPLWAPENGDENPSPPSRKASLTLAVELGEIHLETGKIARLAEGSSLHLGDLGKGTVNLTHEGKHLGKGELIRLGDAIGVKLLKVGG